MQSIAAAGYAATTNTIAGPRDIELKLFERALHFLNDAARTGEFPKKAQAVHYNNRLWSALMTDLASDGNQLPDELRAQLLSLGNFSMRHGDAVLSGEATLDPLLDVNRAVMNGLRAGGGN